MRDRHDTWSGHVGFILAITGLAIGVAGIRKFPYEVGANGGSAFVLFYRTTLIKGGHVHVSPPTEHPSR